MPTVTKYTVMSTVTKYIVGIHVYSDVSVPISAQTWSPEWRSLVMKPKFRWHRIGSELIAERGINSRGILLHVYQGYTEQWCPAVHDSHISVLIPDCSQLTQEEI